MGTYKAIQEARGPALGPNRHVTVINTNDIYFEPNVYDKMRKSPELISKVLGAIESRPGVQRVFLSEQIRDGAHSKDPLVRAAALTYFPGRSGDIVYAANPRRIIALGGT